MPEDKGVILPANNRGSVIYLRKSRADEEAEQHGAGDTLARHREELYALAKRLGLHIDACYEEVVSGDTIAARPQMQRLLSEVGDGKWGNVLVMEISRLARGDTIDQGIVARAFKFSGTRIITPTKTYEPDNEMDEEYFEFSLFMSRQEYKFIRRRMQMGRQASKQEGKFTGSVAPYGYQRHKLPREKGYTLVQDPETAPVVRKIFDWFLYEGLNQHQIACRLNAEGIPSAQQKKWTTASIRDLVKNPHYAGLTTSGIRCVVKTIVDGAIKSTRPWTKDVKYYPARHEGIVSREEWEKACAILATHRSPPAPKIYGLTNPLSGLMICGICGRHMQRRSLRGVGPYLLCPNPDCKCVSSPIQEVEDLLVSMLTDWLDRLRVENATLEQVLPELPELESKRRSAQAEIDKLNAREKRTYELVESGVYDVEEFKRRRDAIQQERAILQSAIEDLNAQISRGEKFLAARNEAIPEMLDALAAYHAATECLDRNKQLRRMVHHVLYYKTIPRTKSNHTTDLHLDIFPLFDADVK